MVDAGSRIMDGATHLADIRSRLVTSAIVTTVTVIEEYAFREQGYFRGRLTLENGDFLEVSEYFAVAAEKARVLRYRYQWMDAAQCVLKRRWDNTRHFPGVPGFPDHIHLGDETVVPGRAMDLIEFMERLETDLLLH